MKVVVNVSSSEDDEDDEGDSDSSLDQGEEDDDESEGEEDDDESEGEEDDDESEVEEDDDESEVEEDDVESEGEEVDLDTEGEYDDEQFGSGQKDDLDFDESVDEGEEYESTSEEQSNDGDDTNVWYRSEHKPTDNELSDKVISLLRQRNKELDVLKLEECKAYLRKHKLMISGPKAACIQRIREHWRLKDGNGERVYPKSSFSINCTGDVCKGDVVVFKQRVYKKFDKVSRSGKVVGHRTIAGRVVKDSYGVAKQQHTFTVEVLWSKGLKSLPPLYPLRIKGRNLYRYKTFRQSWFNEAERCKVLEEKHRRGARARHVRASNRTLNCAGSKRQRNPSKLKRLPNKRLKNVSKVTLGKKRKQTSISSEVTRGKKLKQTSISSEVTRGKKRKQTSISTTCVKFCSKKKIAGTSSSCQDSKKRVRKTKASLVIQSKKSKTNTSSYTHRRQANQHQIEVEPLSNPSQRPTFSNIYDPNYISAGLQTGGEMFHIPNYNHDHNAGHDFAMSQGPHHHHHNHHHHHDHHHHLHGMMNVGTDYMTQPNAGHAYQSDPMDRFTRPYLNSSSRYGSRSSGHFFTNAAHFYNFPRG